MTHLKLPEPISGGLFLSYQCNAECRHCMYACSPKWKDWISEEDLRIVLSQLAGKIKPSPFGPEKVNLNHGLHFTGGEPFLNFKLLLKAVTIAQELNVPSTFVETNCYWCINDKKTREKFQTLKEKGLKGILISVNPFYLEYVPFERTERGIRIAMEIFGENVMVYQLECYLRFKKLGIKGTISLEEYVKDWWDNLSEKLELFLMGRAVTRLKHLYPKYPSDSFLEIPCMPPFIRNWHNHFDNYGNCLPGYCGGISLGSWQALDKLIEEGIDLDHHPVLEFLISQDFKGLLQFAKDSGFQELKEGYISKCDLCTDIRKQLLAKKDINELKPKEFYLYLE
ncbi:MAG: hypothetical protein AMJ89_01470 [candidate division Zixibacteria bacterium SM23_73]|nr:MAG: hypothetical protein AMJ89_01470 [candidate division Zixibacteria bacterium SM23_73]